MQELPYKNNTKIGDLIYPQDEDYGREPIAGKSRKVDLTNLIENIFVSPTSPQWFYDLTKNIVETYRLNKAVLRSSLDIDPIW